MNNKRRWTLQQLEIAVKNSKSLTQVLTKLGLSNSSNNFKRIHKICDDNNYDMSHFTYGSFGTYDEQTFRNAVEKSFSIAQALTLLGLDPSGGSNYRNFNKSIKTFNIDTSHFTGQGHLKDKTHSWSKKTPLDKILVEDSSWNYTNGLRLRLIKENILANVCSECGISDWNGKPISLHLDHINGKRKDNRIENLQILCPNCHSQTNTYCGKNIRVPEKLISEFNINIELAPWEQRQIIADELKNKNSHHNPSIKTVSICSNCDNFTSSSDSKVCFTCHNTNRPFKVPHPSKDELQKLLWEKPTTLIAKDFGVSDKAIEKWSKKYGCTKPPRGYWAKKAAGKV